MEDIFNECDWVINELNKFNKSIVSLGLPITDNRLEIFENQIGFAFPSDFKYILKKHNRISLSGTEIYGIDEKFKGSSLVDIYKYEHFSVEHKMPKEFLPFSPDGRGNHYCIDLSKLKNGLCPVLFWQWDFHYSNNDEIEYCNDNFIYWIKEVMIEWTLEDYNYDGSEK